MAPTANADASANAAAAWSRNKAPIVGMAR
jgi:hypothetical protein